MISMDKEKNYLKIIEEGKVLLWCEYSKGIGILVCEWLEVGEVFILF